MDINIPFLFVLILTMRTLVNLWRRLGLLRLMLLVLVDAKQSLRSFSMATYVTLMNLGVDMLPGDVLV